MRIRTRYTREEREQWLGRLETSGQNAAVFCREHGIRYPALLGWLPANAAGRGAPRGGVRKGFVERLPA